MINSPKVQCVNAINISSHCFELPCADDTFDEAGPLQPIALSRSAVCRTQRGEISLVYAKTVQCIHVTTSKPLMRASVFQETNHLFLRDKITLQSLVNMNDHKKTWFLTGRKPISRSGGLNFFLSLFKLGCMVYDLESD